MGNERANLTTKQQLFIEAYLSNGFNGVEAARAAGYRGSYATLRVIAAENLTKPNIKARIDERLTEAAMPANEVLARLAEIARADMGDFWNVDGGDPRIDFKQASERGKLHLMKSARVTDKGMSFELHDKMGALNTLAKHYGLLKDGVTININIELIVQVVEALQQANLDPKDVFQRMIDHAQAIAAARE